MSSRQRIVLAVGVLAFLALGLFPPCISISGGGAGRPREEVDGHRFVFSLPATEDRSFDVGGDHYSLFISYRVDYPRLGMLLGIVAIVTAGGVLVFKGPA